MARSEPRTEPGLCMNKGGFFRRILLNLMKSVRDYNEGPFILVYVNTKYQCAFSQYIIFVYITMYLIV